MMINARELSKAVNFASSMIASLRKIEAKKIRPIPKTAEGDLPGSISLEALGLTKMVDGFQRYLTINEIDNAGLEGGPFYEASVEIRWKNSKQVSSPEFNLSVKGLLGEKKP
ncbi:MAG: hypothetical protein WA705_22455 [Candidatus Ozemobacteraceae bacterium]